MIYLKYVFCSYFYDFFFFFLIIFPVSIIIDHLFTNNEDKRITEEGIDACTKISTQTFSYICNINISFYIHYNFFVPTFNGYLKLTVSYPSIRFQRKIILLHCDDYKEIRRIQEFNAKAINNLEHFCTHFQVSLESRRSKRIIKWKPRHTSTHGRALGYMSTSREINYRFLLPTQREQNSSMNTYLVRNKFSDCIEFEG